jgi:hypothetical protein
VARLEKADPEDIVLIDTDSQCLFLINQRAGMFPPLDAHGTGATDGMRNSSAFCVSNFEVLGCSMKSGRKFFNLSMVVWLLASVAK